MPLGFAARMRVNRGDRHRHGVGATRDSWYRKWYCGLHLLCGEERVDKYRVPLGRPAKMYVRAGTEDMNGERVAEGDEGFYHEWLNGVHCLMGHEGFKAGLYTVRSSHEHPTVDPAPRLHFKVGARAVVQAYNFMRGDLDFDYQWDVPPPPSGVQHMKILAAETSDFWRNHGLRTEDHDNCDLVLGCSFRSVGSIQHMKMVGAEPREFGHNRGLAIDVLSGRDRGAL